MKFIIKEKIYIKDYYLGPSFSNKEIELKLKYQINYKQIKNVEKHAAKEISSGKVVHGFKADLIWRSCIKRKIYWLTKK